jgi:hypothetical protein
VEAAKQEERNYPTIAKRTLEHFKHEEKPGTKILKF